MTTAWLPAASYAVIVVPPSGSMTLDLLAVVVVAVGGEVAAAVFRLRHPAVGIVVGRPYDRIGRGDGSLLPVLVVAEAGGVAVGVLAGDELAVLVVDFAGRQAVGIERGYLPVHRIVAVTGGVVVAVDGGEEVADAVVAAFGRVDVGADRLHRLGETIVGIVLHRRDVRGVVAGVGEIPVAVVIAARAADGVGDERGAIADVVMGRRAHASRIDRKSDVAVGVVARRREIAGAVDP